MNAWLADNWLRLLAILMVLGVLGAPFASLTLPYAYYQLMNWVVVIASVVATWQAYREHNEWVMWLFILAAVIFNPVAPLFLSAQMWQIADALVVILFALSLYLRPHRKKLVA